MTRKAKEETKARKSELLREMVELYDINTIADIEKTLKEMFAGTMSDMLKNARGLFGGFK